MRPGRFGLIVGLLLNWAGGMPGSWGEDCLMYKYDLRHTGFTPERLSPPLALWWKYSTDVDRDNISAPAVAGNMVYYCSLGMVYGLDVETGSKVWEFPTQSAIRTSPTLAAGLLFVGTDSGDLFALRPEDGKLGWPIGSAITTDNSRAIRTPPVVIEGVLYFAADDGKLYAVDSQTGEDIWPRPMQFPHGLETALCFVGRRLFFTDRGGVLHLIDLARRQQLRALTVGRVASPPVADEQYVYLVGDRRVMALTNRSFRLRWHQDLDGFVKGTPTLAHGNLYVTCTDGYVYAFVTRTGQLLWKQSVENGVLAPATVAGNDLYVGTEGGFVFCLNAATGEVKWKYKLDPRRTSGESRAVFNVLAPPVVANGTLYIMADDGTLYAFRPDVPDVGKPWIEEAQLVTSASDGSGIAVPLYDEEEIQALREDEGDDFKEEDYLQIKGLAARQLPFEFYALITDEGSGLVEDSIVATLDGNPKPLAYDPKTGALTVTLLEREKARVKPRLEDGNHTIMVSAKDWFGNEIVRRWTFKVDNRQPLLEPIAPAQPQMPGIGGEEGGLPGLERGYPGFGAGRRGRRGRRGGPFGGLFGGFEQ
ncbi:MAG TPA: hypothetical protein EYP85_07415 [Armatimonadetes bacterium]|nr:hypothetical protein [Armatimonadota bacterium]